MNIYFRPKIYKYSNISAHPWCSLTDTTVQWFRQFPTPNLRNYDLGIAFALNGGFGFLLRRVFRTCTSGGPSAESHDNLLHSQGMPARKVWPDANATCSYAKFKTAVNGITLLS